MTLALQMRWPHLGRGEQGFYRDVFAGTGQRQGIAGQDLFNQSGLTGIFCAQRRDRLTCMKDRGRGLACRRSCFRHVSDIMEHTPSP